MLALDKTTQCYSLQCNGLWLSLEGDSKDSERLVLSREEPVTTGLWKLLQDREGYHELRNFGSLRKIQVTA